MDEASLSIFLTLFYSPSPWNSMGFDSAPSLFPAVSQAARVVEGIHLDSPQPGDGWPSQDGGKLQAQELDGKMGHIMEVSWEYHGILSEYMVMEIL